MIKIYRLLLITFLLSLSACSTDPQKITFTLLKLNDVYEISTLNGGKTGGSIRIDDVLPAGAITEYDVIKIMPFGGNLNMVQMSGEWVEKALNANKQNRGKGSFLHFAKVTQENGRWLINQQAIDAKKLYKVVITDFLLEKGDNGLEFLTLKNNPSIKRLDVAPIDVRKALIQELTLLNNK